MGGSAAVAVVGPCPSRAPLVAAAAAFLASSAPSSVGAVADCEDAHAAARSALALSEPMALSRAASMLVKAAAVVTAAIAELLALRTWDATTINIQVHGEGKCMACGDDIYRNMAEVDDKSRVVPHDEREHKERSRHVDREPKRCSRTQRADHLHKQDTEQQCGAPSVGGTEGRVTEEDTTVFLFFCSSVLQSACRLLRSNGALPLNVSAIEENAPRRADVPTMRRVEPSLLAERS